MENNNLLVDQLKSRLYQLMLVGKHFSFSEQNKKGKFDSDPIPALFIGFSGGSKLLVNIDSGEITLSVTSGWWAKVKDTTLFVFGGFTENNKYTYFKIETT